MKGIEVKYVVTNSLKEELQSMAVIQTGGMQLVGKVRLFSREKRGEQGRRAYLAQKTDPHFFAKAQGYRIYISLHSGLRPISQRTILENREYIHGILSEMAAFYAESITDGMRRQYADMEDCGRDEDEGAQEATYVGSEKSPYGD